MGSAAEVSGVIQLRSRHSVSETIDRLEAALKERGILVFARIDFSGDAERAGLRMPAEQMLIFGNPKAGTPLMLAVPAAGLDLPLKMLAWEAGDGNSLGRLQRPAVSRAAPSSAGRPGCESRRRRTADRARDRESAGWSVRGRLRLTDSLQKRLGDVDQPLTYGLLGARTHPGLQRRFDGRRESRGSACSARGLPP